MTFSFADFNFDRWTTYGAGKGLEVGLIHSLPFQKLAVNFNAGLEYTDHTIDKDYIVYRTDSLDNIIDTTAEYNTAGLGVIYSKIGTTIQNKSEIFKTIVSYNLSYSHTFKSDDLYSNESIPFKILSNGIGAKYFLYKNIGITINYFNMTIFNEIFKTRNMNRIEIKISI